MQWSRIYCFTPINLLFLTNTMEVPQFVETIVAIRNFIWGAPMLLLLMGTAIYLTLRLRFFQLRYLTTGFANLLKGTKGDKEQGEIRPFDALMTSLSATVGTGNIVGVGVAIEFGGPGAIFWMWMAALFGMATKFSEAVLAVHFRIKDSSGQNRGGPMYYIRNGMGQKWNWLAICYCIFGSIACLGLGNMFQSNAVAGSLVDSFAVPPYVSGLIMMTLVGLVVIGGVKRIALVAGKLVPLMIVIYLIFGLSFIGINYDAIPAAFKVILTSAFSGHAASGGFLGATVAMAISYGVSRSIFSNGAGLGDASIAHAHAQEKNPVKQGSIAMIGVFIDSIIILTMSGLVVVISGVWTTDAVGVDLTIQAYASTYPLMVSQIVIATLLPVFGLTSLMGWCLYGERCIEYMLGQKSIQPYRFLWVFAIFVGAVIKLDIVLLYSDIFNAFMALPNLIALLFLSPIIVKLTKKYTQKLSG